MATPAQNTINFIVKVAQAYSIDDLAQHHLLLADELLAAQDQDSAKAIRSMIDVVDAVGALRFPNKWTEARDSAGYRQDVA